MHTAQAPVTMPKPDETHADVVDRLPAALRSCVHDFGYSVVHAFVQVGINRPGVIRHLIQAVYVGAREAGNRKSEQSTGGGALGLMDNVLCAHGGAAAARPLIATLRATDLTILSREPTDEMIAASCAALTDKGTVTYEQKHRLRLRAALRRGDADRWGWLDQ